MLGEENVVVLVGLEGWIEINEVDALVLHVPAKDVEIVAVVEKVLLALLHRAHFSQGGGWRRLRDGSGRDGVRVRASKSDRLVAISDTCRPIALLCFGHIHNRVVAAPAVVSLTEPVLSLARWRVTEDRKEVSVASTTERLRTDRHRRP